MARPGLVHIGTSGWNYKHWRNDIYPARFGAAKWLSFIAERFDTVELNTSFYRIPKPESVTKWSAQTPEGFMFAVKLWRGITHYKKLLNARAFLTNFFEAVDPLPRKKRAPLLVQLPPNQSKAVEKLSAFLDECREITQGQWRLAVEFRHDSWLDDEVYRLLDRKRAALCLHDMTGKAAVSKANKASFVYVRRHGSAEGRYQGAYSPEQIARDAADIRRWISEGREAYVYYNNDIGGHAFRDALALKAALSG